jgi:hypothetical protein
MTQVVSFETYVEVLGRSISAVIDVAPLGKEYRLHILSKYGIENVKGDNWYSQRQYLKAIEEISMAQGGDILFTIGKSVLTHSAFPHGIDCLEQALRAIDLVYAVNHRGGYIGHFELVTFDCTRRFAEMVCSTPYPSEFDRGIIFSTLTRFKPKDSACHNVWLNMRKPTRMYGNNTCTYLLKW